jgi:formyl-CoA transferase
MSKLEAASLLGSAGVAAAPSNTAEDVLSDSHLRAHKMLLDIPRPDGKEPFTVVGNPIKFKGLPEDLHVQWPRLGVHTDEILRGELGLSSEECGELRSRGVI